jgi:hypothetical protein
MVQNLVSHLQTRQVATNRFLGLLEKFAQNRTHISRVRPAKRKAASRKIPAWEISLARSARGPRIFLV